jgi:hypothetical protein
MVDTGIHLPDATEPGRSGIAQSFREVEKPPDDPLEREQRIGIHGPDLRKQSLPGDRSAILASGVADLVDPRLCASSSTWTGDSGDAS